MSETKTFHAISRGESDWLSVKVTNTLLTDWAGATFQVGLVHGDETIMLWTPDIITTLNAVETRLDVLLGPAGHVVSVGQYLPTAKVTKGAANFTVDCEGDVVVVD